MVIVLKGSFERTFIIQSVHNHFAREDIAAQVCSLSLSSYRDTQPQLGENYPSLVNLKPQIFKFCYLNNHFIPDISDVI